jgi:hypothetical protein
MLVCWKISTCLTFLSEIQKTETMLQVMAECCDRRALSGFADINGSFQTTVESASENHDFSHSYLIATSNRTGTQRGLKRMGPRGLCYCLGFICSLRLQRRALLKNPYRKTPLKGSSGSALFSL